MRKIGIFLGCLLGILVVATHEPLEPAPDAAASAPDFVRVEHRLVTVRAERMAADAPGRTAQKAARVTRSHTPRRPFLARARQLVLGDGRVRPEPFPRPAER